jgi:hypothetical protein
MKKLIPFLLLTASIGVLLAATGQSAAAQGAGKLIVFSDMALFAGPNQPRNCFTMNRYKTGEPVGFRVTVIDPVTGEPAKDTEVLVHLTYGGKTETVPARYRGEGRGNLIPNLWTAKWAVPAGAPTGKVDVVVTAKDKQGRTGEWKPYPNVAAMLTIVNE